ncbi:3-dehydroquinate synthase, partial [Klebsiella pneumoniae]|uniref:3-dehydroquinate synthase family protein n=1 Tax=Klebsiella pneumoniae TaxID=573 RepID=UPI00403AE6CB|nr:3-dehydroquinate synthase [Klebsiella pneumoniae]
VTLYRRFKHGEAVGHGMLMAGALSKKLDILPENDLNSLNDVVHRSGRLPVLNGIGRRELLAAFSFDKKSVSDSLRFVLLAGIGKPVVISEQDI